MFQPIGDSPSGLGKTLQIAYEPAKKKYNKKGLKGLSPLGLKKPK